MFRRTALCILLTAAGSFALPAELPAAAPQGFGLAPLAKVYAKTVKRGKVVPAADGRALCRFELAEDGERHTAAPTPERFKEKEHGGIEFREATGFRIGFFLKYPVKPMKIRVGGVFFGDRPPADRMNFKLPVK